MKEAKAEITHNLELANCLRKTKANKHGKKNASPCLMHGTRNGLANPNSLKLLVIDS